MTIAESIRLLSYDPHVRKCVQRLGLTGLMQSLYGRARSVQTGTSVLKLRINGVECLFSVLTPNELRCIEGAVLTNERRMLGGVCELLKPGNIFLDVGSNLGVFAVLAAKVVGPVGTVIACEPGSGAFGRLQANIEINQLTNVSPLKLALSDTRSVRRLVLGGPGSCDARLTNEEGPSEDVETTDYDSLVAQGSVPVPHVVKMDIEGHEYAALKGMQNTLADPRCAAILCEIHPYALRNGISDRHITSLIESLGFQCVSLRKRGGEHQVIATKHSTGLATRRNRKSSSK